MSVLAESVGINALKDSIFSLKIYNYTFYSIEYCCICMVFENNFNGLAMYKK